MNLMQRIVRAARQAETAALKADDCCKAVPRATRAAVDAETVAEWALWLETLAKRIDGDRAKRKDVKVKTLIPIAELIEQCAIQAREYEREARKIAHA
jgi:hypothetical protein